MTGEVHPVSENIMPVAWTWPVRHPTDTVGEEAFPCRRTCFDSEMRWCKRRASAGSRMRFRRTPSSGEAAFTARSSIRCRAAQTILTRRPGCLAAVAADREPRVVRQLEGVRLKMSKETLKERTAGKTWSQFTAEDLEAFAEMLRAE